MINLLFSVLGFIPLIVGATWLVDGASSVAKKRNISNLVIGLTIVAFGTSSPELVVNLLAATSGNSGFSFGNVVGSNIINILLIMGLAAVIYPMSVKSPTIWIEIPLCLLSALILVIMANDHWLDGASSSWISRSDGLLLLGFFFVFMYYSWFAMKRSDEDHEIKIKSFSNGKSWLMIIVGMILLAGGGQLIVYFAEKFAKDFGISDRIIGLTVLSIGTSLPELSTSVVAAIKKNADISIGNIIGSNLFNTFLILGASATVGPIQLERGSNMDLWVNVLATLLLFVFVFTRKGRMIDRLEGSVMVLVYGGYLYFILS
ncbi:MAG TPA: calcium/sodium antiporter [Bacteroidales bacterium]|nr:calcium/sodium antiporter [Bacteroidales bacterium]HPE57335.1 calcium/sodium antiporter [Bacteroidales bacterium]HRX96650.1 calcium/sodium antiporter [Bacteroidales bacterium]